MTLILGPEDVAVCTAMDVMIEAVEAGVREEASGAAVVPPRANLPTSNGFFRVMPAVMRESGVMGFKVFNGSIEEKGSAAGLSFTQKARGLFDRFGISPQGNHSLSDVCKVHIICVEINTPEFLAK